MGLEIKLIQKIITARSLCFFAMLVGTTFLWVDIVSTDIINSLITMNKLLSKMQSKRNKYILIWTAHDADPIKYLGTGQEAFLQKNCAQTNCYVTSSRSFFYNESHFDAIIFHGPEIVRKYSGLPKKRSTHQIYMFASMESPTHYPSCNQSLNEFFNWTWTHKLKSDLLYVYMIIKDRNGNIIGPAEDINWKKVENMEPIDEALKSKLEGKHKAAAWFVSNCGARNNRRQVASDIKEELEKYGFTLDVYGRCGWMSCDMDSGNDCSKLIEDQYYFYLSFENSFSEDYVTEKLLRPLKHYTVPVVYGGANYTRFMPDGIYLNARMVDVEDLVKQMVYLMNNKDEYYKYFRWHNHYSYHLPTDFPETDPYCNLCAAINDKKNLTRNHTSYCHFDEWWNDANACGEVED